MEAHIEAGLKGFVRLMKIEIRDYVPQGVTPGFAVKHVRNLVLAAVPEIDRFIAGRAETWI